MEVLVRPADAQAYLRGLREDNDHELEELRRTSIETKAQQLWTLMTAGDLLEDAAEREASVQAVRERWAALRRALDV